MTSVILAVSACGAADVSPLSGLVGDMLQPVMATPDRTAAATALRSVWAWAVDLLDLFFMISNKRK